MPKIRMLKSQCGSDEDADGRVHPPKTYLAGQEYDVGPKLAHALVVDLGCAVLADEPETPEGKSLGAAPENKSGRGRRR